MTTILRSKSLPWDVVEKKIKEEIGWLRGTIDFYQEGKSVEPITCHNCLLRLIAVSIVSGAVRAREIKKAKGLRCFWPKKPGVIIKKPLAKMSHGEEWHRQTMQKIEDYFLSYHYEVVREPDLNWGRADLEISKKNEPALYIEVGKVSLFKLWMNLSHIGNSTHLLVPNDDKLIEFVC